MWSGIGGSRFSDVDQGGSGDQGNSDNKTWKSWGGMTKKRNLTVVRIFFTDNQRCDPGDSFVFGDAGNSTQVG